MDSLRLKTNDKVLLAFQNEVKKGEIKTVDLNHTTISLKEEINFTAPKEHATITNTVQLQPFSITHTVLENLNGKILDIMFGEDDNLAPPPPYMNFQQVTGHLSESQRLCVGKILAHEEKVPFVVTGAPGSGKSAMMIESVCQLILLGKYTHPILVTSPSNAAVFGLAKKFRRAFQNSQKDLLKPDTIVKIVCSSALTEHSCIDVCDLDDRKIFHIFPTLEKLIRAKVIITTPQTAVKLFNIKNKNGTVNLHVSCMFNDEAAYTSEPVTFTPLVTQLSDGIRPIKTILLGDPHQLTYVSRSLSVKARQGVDTITRLLKSPLYRNNKHLHFDLCENFRNAQNIVHLLNEIEYNNSIIPRVLENGELKAVHIDTCYEKMEGNSAYSSAEAKKCIDLAKECVGTKKIITVYKAQESMIKREIAEQKVPEVFVATAESAQGDEAETIILTTTLRTTDSPWLEDYNRTCMILSRARKNLWLVGDLCKLAHISPYKPILRNILKTGNLDAPAEVETIIKETLRN